MQINVTLRQLEAFVAVARTLSFSLAAQQVHLSQPALSATIRKLEDAIGARLFDRTTRTVALTSVGMEVLAIAENLLRELDDAFVGVRALVGGKRGRVAIAASPSLAAGFVPEVVATFQRTYPYIDLQVHDAVFGAAIELIRAGKVDLAITPEKFADAELKHRELFRDHLVLLCRSDHPLAKLRTVTWKDLQPHSLVSLTSKSSVRHLVEAAYLQHGTSLRPAFEVEHASTVMGFVAQGLGVGVLPFSLIPLVRVKRVVYRRITRPEIHRLICIVTLKSRSPSPAAEAFIRTCIDHATSRTHMRER